MQFFFSVCIRGISVRDICIKNICIKDNYIRNICIKNVFIKNTSIKDAYNINTVKYLEIYLKLSTILKLKQYCNILKIKKAVAYIESNYFDKNLEIRGIKLKI